MTIGRILVGGVQLVGRIIVGLGLMGVVGVLFFVVLVPLAIVLTVYIAIHFGLITALVVVVVATIWYALQQLHYKKLDAAKRSAQGNS